LVYEIAPDLNLVRIIAAGRPTPRHFLEVTERLLGDPDWHPGTNLLIDYRRLRTFAFKTDGIREISRLFRDRADELGDGRCAVVTPNLLIYGLFRMWYPWLPDELQWTVESFDDIDDAQRWLGLEVDPGRFGE
jgi:hypothetical protein